jgi:uncharacterized membrane protein
MAGQRAAKAEVDGGRIMYIVAYILPVLGGLTVYFLFSGRDRRMRFHAVQSAIYWIAWLVLYYVLLTALTASHVFLWLGWILSLLWLAVWLAAIYVGYEAALGVDMDIPLVAGVARNAS